MSNLILKIDFAFNLDKREEVVEMIQNKVLTSNVSHNSSIIELPSKYKNLSKGGGEVNVKEGSIFFYTFRGILDNFSGFVYMPDDNEPYKHDFLCSHMQLKKMKDHWFWMGCT